MNIILKNSALNKKNIITDSPISVFHENILQINNNYEKGTITKIQLDSSHLILKNLKINTPSKSVTHNSSFFKLQFEIKGSSLYTPLNKLSTPIYIPNKHCNLFYLPEVKGTLHYNTNYRKTFEVFFTEESIIKIIQNHFKNDLKNLDTAIKNKKPFLMWEKSKPIPLEALSCIQDIVNCEYLGNFKKVYLEAKTNELLIILLAQTNNNEINNKLSNEEYLNILKINDYIKQNLQTQLCISELAVITGMNTSKLKQNFKIIFSKTIFKHITALRMEKAKNLIINKHYTVAEASLKVGYKYPQHFTVAFKKQYGYLPSELNNINTHTK